MRRSNPKFDRNQNSSGRERSQSSNRNTDSRAKSERFGEERKPKFDKKKDDAPKRERNQSGGRRSNPKMKADDFRDDRKERSRDRKPKFSDRKPKFDRNQDRPKRGSNQSRNRKAYSQSDDFRDDRKERSRDRKPKFDRNQDRPKRGSNPSGNRKSYSQSDDSRGNRKTGGFSDKKYKSFDNKRGYGNSSFRKRSPKEETPQSEDIRLNKYVANAGICSRRQADEYIKTGVVEVNGVVITEMGFKVKPGDEVRFDGRRISPEKKVYLLLNKPKGYITTTHDERDRKTVMDLVAGATSTRLFPVGRLDRQTTGVLLFTNDGHFAKKMTHPSHQIKKIYHVFLDKNLHGDDMEKVRQGIAMQEGVAEVDKISFIEGKPHNEVGVELHIGWNRVVRRIFEKLGYKVERLDRVTFAGLTKKNLKRGQWRMLTDKEVDFLNMI